MSLGAGHRLGPYEILALIGAGGMGEVYKARDTRLERTVAIKILREHLAESAERRERFEREATALSQLNHAHICTLHDVGNQDGIGFLVMEHVSGENLADRLKRGALSAPQALAFGVQIADALDAAHRLGIVHRDLKPGNIVVTEAGVKLLDFGLARLVAPGSGRTDSLLDTEHKPLTSEGAILGTFQYMAPEQLEGKAADARTDLFALGVVLHEMLTGQKAFSGKTQASLIAAILAREPEPISKLEPLSPRSLDRVVARCLAKDPAARWGSAGEVRELLRFVSEDGGPISTGEPRSAWTRWLPWAVAGSTVAIALGVLAFFRAEPPPDQPLAHFVIVPADDAPLGPTEFYRDLALSPNGEHLVYSGGSTRQLYVRHLGQTEIATLVGPGGDPSDPFFSPDSEWVGFYVNGSWKKVSVSGGPAMTLWSTTAFAAGASWGPNGEIVLASDDLTTGLLRLSAAGGEPEVLTRPDASASELDHYWPEFLPSGKAVLFDVVSSQWESQVAVLSLETGERKVLISSGANARYVETGQTGETGHILYVAEGALRAVRFDPDRLEVEGTPFPVLERVHQNLSLAANYAVSENGTLAYNPNAGVGDRRALVWVDRDGRITPLPLPTAAYHEPSLSPDGKRIALAMTDESGTNIWVYDIGRGTLGKRTFGGQNLFPIWTPDGEEILYCAGMGFQRLMRLRADGARGGEEMNVELPSPGSQIPISWSDVHRTLLFQYNAETWRFSVEDEKAEPFLKLAGATLREARFSPDETHVAYRSNESGRDEIYVVPYPSLGGKWQISTDGGAQPMWSLRGGELFYKNGNRMMAVKVRTSPTFEASTPRVLFETDLPERVPGDPSRYGVTPDGRFLVTAPAPNAENEEKPEIHVIVNWLETLRDRPPKP